MKPGQGKEFLVDVGDSTGQRTRPPEQRAAVNNGQHHDDHAPADNCGQRKVVHDRNFTRANPGPFRVGQSRGAGQDAKP